MPEECTKNGNVASKEDEMSKTRAINKIIMASQMAKAETRPGRKMLSVDQRLFPDGRVYVNEPPSNWSKMLE